MAVGCASVSVGSDRGGLYTRAARGGDTARRRHPLPAPRVPAL